jgi:hypothetical protein
MGQEERPSPRLSGQEHLLLQGNALFPELNARVFILGSKTQRYTCALRKTAAGILTGKDPVQRALLARDRKTLSLPRPMENFVCHLGDHDWILTVPVAKWIIPGMEVIAVEKYGMAQSDLKTKKFNMSGITQF